MNFNFDNFLKATNNVLKELSTCEAKENIYHYTGIEGFKSIIENSSLRFTDRSYLNDKLEGVYVLDLFIDNYDYVVSETPLGKAKEEMISAINDYKEHIQEKIFKIFQASFSLDCDSLCMWNYYTKGNGIKGFNIGFDSSVLRESINSKINDGEDKPYIFAGKVSYNVTEQLEKLKEFVTCIYEAIYKDVKTNLEADVENKAIKDFIHRPDIILERITLLGIFFKKPCFEMEHEYRIAVDLHIADGEVANTNETIKYTCKDNGFIAPCIDLKFDLSSITKIMVSPTMDKEETTRNLNVFLAGKCKDKIEVKGSDIPVRY